MTLSATGSTQFPSIPGGSGYSVSKGSTDSVSFRDVDNMLKLWWVAGISATTPTNFGDLSSTTTRQVAEDADRLSASSGSGGYNGTYQTSHGTSHTGWTVGTHLWLMLFDQTAAPAGTDVPFAILDLGTVVA